MNNESDESRDATEEAVRRAEEEGEELRKAIEGAAGHDSILHRLAIANEENLLPQQDDYPHPAFLASDLGMREFQPHPARDFFEALQQQIRIIERSLKESQELLVYHIDPAGRLFPVRDFFYESPELVILRGEEGVTMMHVQSLQIRLDIRELEDDQRRPIGFNRRREENA